MVRRTNSYFIMILSLSKGLGISYSKFFFLKTFVRSLQTMNYENYELLREFTGCSISKIQKKLKSIEPGRMESSELKWKLEHLKDLDVIDKSHLDRIRLIKLHPYTVRNRCASLYEYGLKREVITSTLVSRYLSFCKSSVEDLKNRNMLDRDANVEENLLKYLPTSLQSSYNCKCSDKNSLTEIRLKIVEHFLVHHMGLTEHKYKTVLRRLTHKSLRTIFQNLNILEKDFNLSLEKIAKNKYLLPVDPENILSISSQLPTIAGVKIQDIVRIHPKILACRVQNLYKMLDVLKEFNICETAMQKCFEVFTLSPETVKKRLEYCQKDVNFSVSKYHPRVLELVLSQEKAKKRLKILQELKVNHTSINKLVSLTHESFERFLEVGSDRRSYSDMLYLLTRELNMPKAQLKKILMAHPYWAHIPLLTVSSNLNLLLEKGFTREEISDEIYILLYPTKNLLDEYHKMNFRKETGECRDRDGVVKRECILPLLVYFLERDTDFSGAGVWGRDPPPTSDLPPPTSDLPPPTSDLPPHS